MKYKVVITKIIMMGLMDETHIIEAENSEQAEEIANDSDDFLTDIDYRIEQKEVLSIETEEV